MDKDANGQTQKDRHKSAGKDANVSVGPGVMIHSFDSKTQERAGHEGLLGRRKMVGFPQLSFEIESLPG